MDRVQFLHKLEIEGQDFAATVLNSFDQLMALYCIVGQHDNVNVSSEGNLTFTVSFSEIGMVDKLVGIIVANCNRIIIYERQFGIIINWQNDLQVNLTIA